MTDSLWAAATAIVGIVLGGGLKAAETAWARKKEGEGVLSALCAEVEAINRLIDHRAFVPAVTALQSHAAELMRAGRPQDPSRWMTLHVTRDYFTTYDALSPKLGLLHPYYADRISRYYTYAKAALENFDPSSPHQSGITAEEAHAILGNDLQLLQTVLALGRGIARFRDATPPKGVVDPFLDSGVEPQIGAGAFPLPISSRGEKE